MKRIQIADFDRRMPPLELREMDDYYEAVLVSNYDELYPSTQVRTIQLADIYVNLVMTSEGAHLVSALFLKPVEVPDIVAWMQLYTIVLRQRTQQVTTWNRQMKF